MEALGMVLAMAAVILFCRAFPFLFFSRGNVGGKSGAMGRLIGFVEKIVPPAAMTVLAFNVLGTSFKIDPRDGFFALGASLFTAVLHLWKRNFLMSILGGTAVYMILCRLALQ
jgi:branched-subunit amino acid transport protein AzlD